MIPVVRSETAAATPMSQRIEGPDTPKLCLPANLDQGDAGIRRVTQLGVKHVMSGGLPMPWQEAEVRSRIERFKAAGVTLGNMMIAGFPNTIYGKPARDKEIEMVVASIEAAGKAGLPVIEYNFYAHRALEGYYGEVGRGGSGYTSFDYDVVKGLPPLPQEGAHSLDEMWANVTYFLKAVIPVAEKANVRMALHPNDPPVPLIRGSGQIMGSLEGWKHLIEIVNSPANGITFDCGVTREMGEDPVEICRYFGSRDRISHMHFRNVRMHVPHEKYTEVFPDEGDVDLFAVMKELVRQKYPRLLFPEHPRGMDLDREMTAPPPHAEPGAGAYPAFIFNVGYARALFQVAVAGT